jgi:hypothetical protein
MGEPVQKTLAGNPNLKGSEYTEVISKEEYDHRITELLKCKRDIVYFANHYFHIINLDTGLGLIELYPKQEELLRFMADEKRTIVLASRQTGKSTCYTIFVLWLCIFHPEKKVLIAANKSSTATELVGRIKLAYEHLPMWLKCGVKVWNAQEVVFTNLSSFKGASTSSDAARGTSCNVLILDEFAFIPNNLANKFFTSVYPIISSSKESKVIIVSTPNGVGNLYHEIWEEANDKLNESKDGWKGFRIDWFDVPDRDEEWKEIQIKSIGQERFDQEFGNSFLASSFQKLITDDQIDKFRKFQHEHKDLGKDIEIHSRNKTFEFRCYHPYDPKRTYLISGDPSDGVGQDFAVAYVWDVTDLANVIMVAKYANAYTTPTEFAFVLNKLAECYGKPFIGFESNNIGRSVLDTMENIYEYENFVRMDKHNRIGIQSHVQIKSKACIWVQEFMNTECLNVIIYDTDIMDDMDKFVKKDTAQHIVYKAIGKRDHDDHIMSLVWALWILHPDNVEYYFTVIEYGDNGLGRSIPRYLAPLYPPDADIKPIELNSKKILDAEWREQKAEMEKQIGIVYDREEALQKLNWDGTLNKDEYEEEFEGDGGFGFFM